MDLRQLTPDLAVSAQIRPEDVPALADAGFRVLINNRPDAEVGEDENDAAMRKAAEDAGLSYFYIPFSPGQVTPDMITAQKFGISHAWIERGRNNWGDENPHPHSDLRAYKTLGELADDVERSLERK